MIQIFSNQGNQSLPTLQAGVVNLFEGEPEVAFCSHLFNYGSACKIRTYEGV